MMSDAGFKRKSKAASNIPSSSLADMAFLLLIFFMVSTTFRREQTRKMPWPQAEETKKLEEARKDILHIYLQRDGTIFINDQMVQPQDVHAIVAPLYAESQQRLVVVLRADRDVPYHFINAVQTELQAAHAVRVTFYTDLEHRMTRQRR